MDIVKAMWLRRERRRRAIRTITGVPPLTFKGKGKNLKNYRIYGNTENGESVGDRTKNLLQNMATNRTYAVGITLVVNDDKSVVVNGTSNTGNPIGIILGGNVVIGKGTYTLSGCPQGGSSNTYKLICIFDDGGERKVLTDNGDGATVVLNNDTATVINNGFYISALSCDNSIFYPMLRKAETTPTYEPYGYRVPVTVTNGTDTETTNLYLPEQIKKVGDDAEYIDFVEQKQYFADGTSTDVTLPALPTLSGTNTLSVETQVQPSEVYIKGKIKEVRESESE